MSAAVRATLALALGIELDDPRVSWHSALEVARRERCAPLAWFRSATQIRAHAPSSVVSEWREEAVSSVALADFWLELLRDTIRVLQAAGAAPVVLKGLPLAERLYGNCAARPCADLDLYVAPDRRAVADLALKQMGWSKQRGEGTKEAVYRINLGDRAGLLEVHSFLLDDALVGHLRFRAPSARPAVVGEIRVPMHSDDQLPAFLAAHLAKHSMPPLLWFVDFKTLWNSLSPDEKRDSWLAARGARAHRYLQWAIEQSAGLEKAVAGDRRALRNLGVDQLRRSEIHSALRVALLAAGLIDFIRVLRAWAFSVESGRGWRGRAELILARARKLVVHGIYTHASIASAKIRPDAEHREFPRTVALEHQEFALIARELAQNGANFRIRVSGGSMRPSIEPGATVCLRSPSELGTAVGDVALVQTAKGAYVLHRVCAVGKGWVQTKGDANYSRDAVVGADSVVAVATGIVVDGEVRTIPRSRFIRMVRALRRVLVPASLQLGAARRDGRSGRSNERVAQRE